MSEHGEIDAVREEVCPLAETFERVGAQIVMQFLTKV